MPFCFHTFMPMKRNMSSAGFRLAWAVLTFVTNFCSWFIVISKVVKINAPSASVYSSPSYFVEHIPEFYRVSQIISTSISAADLSLVYTWREIVSVA